MKIDSKCVPPAATPDSRAVLIKVVPEFDRDKSPPRWDAAAAAAAGAGLVGGCALPSCDREKGWPRRGTGARGFWRGEGGR